MGEPVEDDILVRIARKNRRALEKGVFIHATVQLVQADDGVYGIRFDENPDPLPVEGEAP